MTEQPNTRTTRTYKVNSLDRGLDVLRVIRNADGPVRNSDIATSTGLPKATVSRLVHTLTAMGYLRRIDQGSYVLGQASGRTGRAMLEALRLERYTPLFQELVASSGTYACLGMMVQKKMVPVFRWSATGGILLTSGVDANAANDHPLIVECANFLCDPALRYPAAENHALHQQLSDTGWCQQWDAGTERFSACTGVRISSVALCILTLHLPQSTRPSAKQLATIGTGLLKAASAIASESPEK